MVAAPAAVAAEARRLRVAGPALSPLSLLFAMAADGVGAPSMLLPPPTPPPPPPRPPTCLLAAAAATAASSPSSALGTGGAEPGEAIFRPLEWENESGEKKRKKRSFSLLFSLKSENVFQAHHPLFPPLFPKKKKKKN